MIETTDIQEEAAAPAEPVGLDAGAEQLLRALAGRAAAAGLSLAGEGGFLHR
jgi:hypothetical protein